MNKYTLTYKKSINGEIQYLVKTVQATSMSKSLEFLPETGMGQIDDSGHSHTNYSGRREFDILIGRLECVKIPIPCSHHKEIEDTSRHFLAGLASVKTFGLDRHARR